LGGSFLDLDGVNLLAGGGRAAVVSGRGGHEPGTVAGAAGFLHLDCGGAAATNFQIFLLLVPSPLQSFFFFVCVPL
jgi:hypothetical protein